jgi:VanZ family protein
MLRNPRLLLPIFYMAALFAMSSIPGKTMEVTPGLRLVTPQWQNLLHIPVFGGLTLVWFWALQSGLRAKKRGAYTALVFTIVYACVDEAWQTRIPGRLGSLTDLGLNTLGALLALWSINAGWLDRAKG